MSEIPPPTVPPSTPPPGGSYTPPPPTGGTAPSSDRTIFLVLSYIWILFIIPLLARKEDAEVQWHAKNGMVLFFAEIAWSIIQYALGHFAALGCVSGIVGCIVWLIFLAIRIVCIVKAVSGQRFRIPVLTDIAEKM